MINREKMRLMARNKQLLKGCAAKFIARMYLTFIRWLLEVRQRRAAFHTCPNAGRSFAGHSRDVKSDRLVVGRPADAITRLYLDAALREGEAGVL